MLDESAEQARIGLADGVVALQADVHFMHAHPLIEREPAPRAAFIPGDAPGSAPSSRRRAGRRWIDRCCRTMPGSILVERSR
jgi:hypothetical protein